MRDFPERDWKVFTRVQRKAIERFNQRVLDDVARILQDSRRDVFDRREAISELVRKSDKELHGRLSDYRRSTAVWQLCAFCQQGLLTEDELALFSDETRALVQGLWLPAATAQPATSASSPLT